MSADSISVVPERIPVNNPPMLVDLLAAKFPTNSDLKRVHEICGQKRFPQWAKSILFDDSRILYEIENHGAFLNSMIGPEKIEELLFLLPKERISTSEMWMIAYLGSGLSTHEPNFIHGGATATLCDQMSVFSALYLGKFLGFTKTLNIEYIRPVPVNSYIFLRIQLISISEDGRKASTICSCENGEGKILLKVEGKFQSVQPKL